MDGKIYNPITKRYILNTKSNRERIAKYDIEEIEKEQEKVKEITHTMESEKTPRSPKRTSKTPKRAAKSPKRGSKTPGSSTRSPKRNSKTPKGLAKSPKRLSKTPKRSAKTPKKTRGLSPERPPVADMGNGSVAEYLLLHSERIKILAKMFGMSVAESDKQNFQNLLSYARVKFPSVGENVEKAVQFLIESKEAPLFSNTYHLNYAFLERCLKNGYGEANVRANLKKIIYFSFDSFVKKIGIEDERFEKDFSEFILSLEFLDTWNRISRFGEIPEELHKVLEKHRSFILFVLKKSPELVNIHTDEERKSTVTKAKVEYIRKMKSGQKIFASEKQKSEISRYFEEKGDWCKVLVEKQKLDDSSSVYLDESILPIQFLKDRRKEDDTIESESNILSVIELKKQLERDNWNEIPIKVIMGNYTFHGIYEKKKKLLYFVDPLQLYPNNGFLFSVTEMIKYHTGEKKVQLAEMKMPDTDEEWDCKTKTVWLWYMLFVYYFEFSQMLHDGGVYKVYNESVNKMGGEKFFFLLQFAVFVYENYFKFDTDITNLNWTRHPLEDKLTYAREAYETAVSDSTHQRNE